MPGGEEQKVMQLIAQQLGQGVSPKQVAQELVQAGLPQNEAVSLVRNVEGRMRGPPRGGGGPPRRRGGGVHLVTILLLVIFVLLVWFIVG